MRRTIKVKAYFPKEKFLPLMEICADVFNRHVDWSFKNKTYNKSKAHKALYLKLRELYPKLPSALIQSIRDSALGNIKATNFEFRPNKKKTSGVCYDKRCANLRGNLLTISTLDKRERTLVKIPKYHQEIFKTWNFTGLQLCFDHKKQVFYVCLNYEKKPPKVIKGDVLGIDRGLKNIVYCSNGYKASGKKRNRIKRRYNYNRKQIQAKGTRSASRKLSKVRYREKRFGLNENHIIAKELVNLPYQTYVLEDLSGIRDNKNKDSKKKKKRRSKSMKRQVANWSYYQLELILKYKAEILGKEVCFVDARYTSQKCNNCEYIDKKNRKSDKFECKKCGHKDHADFNAAKNIRDLWIKFPTGQADCQPAECSSFWNRASLQASPVGS